MPVDLGVDPTVVLVGLNRSGTTALSQCFLNHPNVELHKDPGKYIFESTSVADFSHFFMPPRLESTQARVVKVSIGQYTTELCTIPIYPMMQERPQFLRRLHHVFVIRDPVDLWMSWLAMTKWIRSTEDARVRQSWRTLQRDKGIEAGWGSIGLFDLAYRYLYQTLLYVESIAPTRTWIVDFQDFQRRDVGAGLVRQISESAGIRFLPEMITWKIRFGDSCDRLVDGIRRSLDDPERQYIHRSILKSDGLGFHGERSAVKHDQMLASERTVLDGLGVLFKTMVGRRSMSNTSRT